MHTKIKPDYIQMLKCNFTKKCSTRSLPIQSVQVCPSSYHDLDIDMLCSNFVFHLLGENQPDHCKKACSVREFRVKDKTEKEKDCFSNSKWFSMEYEFGSPDSSKELRSRRPFKTVHKEYYILDERGMIGNIGGTISLFTGFSFFGIATWIVVYLKWVMVKMVSSK